MKKTAIVFLLAALVAAPASGHVLEELWHKYSPEESAAAERKADGTKPVAARADEKKPGAGKDDAKKDEAAKAEAPAWKKFPGRNLDPAARRTGEAAFDHPWRYRDRVYEIHYAKPVDLARSIYSLALHVKDISPDLPREKFYNGVLGHHYSLEQVCSWLNASPTLSREEGFLAGLLLQDNILTMEKGKFLPAGDRVHHILAAAPGEKRPFEKNLRHERLHVFWDEDAEFRDKAHKEWKAMTEAERAAERGKLRNYSQDNEKQLVEEWRIRKAEASSMDLK